MNLLLLIMFMFIFISLIMIILNILFSKKMKMVLGKNYSFECGFDSFMSSRLPFSIHFYLIGVLFLVFDIEIVLLFPIIKSLNLLNYFNWMFSMMIILIILYLGLEYEKDEGSLKWFK